ncbi:hypothetical protein ACG0Z4_30020, partial [Enterocloster aldenensis]|uniref:hypothetical protein n=1 Tax=Enterocloster aldenensis TaxID=358742 RepID=UPI004027C202
VEYYYDGEKDSSKTETLSATYQDVVGTYTDKNITGYKLAEVKNLPLTIGADANENVIKVYYVRDSFKYSVEYYYDGDLDKAKTDGLLAKYQDVIDSYTDKNITGYKFSKVENLPLTIGTDAGENVIRVYYVKDTFDYTVEYYYDGEKDDSKTETSSATYQDVVGTYTDKNIAGYKLAEVKNLPLTIGTDASGNVIRVYYVKDTFGYTVEYYYDGEKDDSKTETSSATYQDVIGTYTDKNITGYKFSKVENLPLTIGTDASENVIRVYYVKDAFEYTVEYYYDGEKDDSKTETSSATYQDVVGTYTDKNITGYKFSKVENLPLTIGADASKNVIRVYYVKDVFGYTVEYYYDGEKDDSKTETSSATYQDVVRSYTDKNITGYRLADVENLPLTIGTDANGNVIRVYYVKDTFGYTVEYYYDGEKD